MLKLMKYEFIHSMRSFLLSFFVFWIACFILPFFSGEYLPEIPVFSFLLAFGFIVLIMGISLALFVSIATRYYHSMFKRPAYLTLTLPVSSWQLIGSKIVISYLWLIIGSFALLLGIGITVIVSAFISQDVSLGIVFQMIPELFNEFVNKFGVNFSLFLQSFLYATVEIYFFIISVYFALTVVHTKWCRRYRLAVALIIWIALELVVSMIRSQWLSTDLLMMFYNLFVSVIFTVATVYVIDHHIEIE